LIGKWKEIYTRNNDTEEECLQTRRQIHLQTPRGKKEILSKQTGEKKQSSQLDMFQHERTPYFIIAPMASLDLIYILDASATGPTTYRNESGVVVRGLAGFCCCVALCCFDSKYNIHALKDVTH
jgi:hypothetical protein